MNKIHNNQITILSNLTINDQLVYEFLYQNRIYSLQLNPNDMFEADKIKLLDSVNYDFNRIVPNPVKIAANTKYLIFTVRYQLNLIQENFCFTSIAKTELIHN